MKTTRKDAINQIRYAGYHQDQAQLVRLYVENHISYLTAKQAYFEGYIARKNGVKCTCHMCT